MNTLKVLEKAIDNLAYVRAMIKIEKKKSIKTWKRLSKKLKELTGKERDKIINRLMTLI